jgi:hypothetical protein
MTWLRHSRRIEPMPADWLCEALGVSRGGFYAWLTRPRSQRSRSDEELGAKVRASFLARDRTYGARRVWHDMLEEGLSCGLHRIERLMRLQALKARPRRRRLPPDLGERQIAAVAPNVLDRTFEASAPNRKWIADFTLLLDGGRLALRGCHRQTMRRKMLLFEVPSSLVEATGGLVVRLICQSHVLQTHSMQKGNGTYSIAIEGH